MVPVPHTAKKFENIFALSPNTSQKRVVNLLNSFIKEKQTLFVYSVEVYNPGCKKNAINIEGFYKSVLYAP